MALVHLYRSIHTSRPRTVPIVALSGLSINRHVGDTPDGVIRNKRAVSSMTNVYSNCIGLLSHPHKTYYDIKELKLSMSTGDVIFLRNRRSAIYILNLRHYVQKNDYEYSLEYERFLDAFENSNPLNMSHIFLSLSV